MRNWRTGGNCVWNCVNVRNCGPMRGSMRPGVGNCMEVGGTALERGGRHVCGAAVDSVRDCGEICVRTWLGLCKEV